MRRKTYNRYVTVLFLGFLFFFLLLSLFRPDQSFSQRENRHLQTLPKFSFERLFSGDFTAEFEDYCADQFPFRDVWITINARYEQLCGKKQTNGVYLCGERLIVPFFAPSEKELNRRIKAVELLSESASVPVTLALIPDAAEIYAEELPTGAPNDSQSAVIESVEKTGISSAPLLRTLREHREEEIFYRTDHHWTTLGAYYGYSALCESLGLTAQGLDTFEPETVSTSFYGTAYSSSGYTWVEPDHIERYVDSTAARSVVSYRSGEGTEVSLYREESLQQKDQYTYFLGGNTPEIVLKGQDESLPKLLLVRDSYSDSLAPFLLAHYSEIRMLDLRYYLGSVTEYAATHEMDQILVMYSVANFCTENGVLALAQ